MCLELLEGGLAGGVGGRLVLLLRAQGSGECGQSKGMESSGGLS